MLFKYRESGYALYYFLHAVKFSTSLYSVCIDSENLFIARWEVRTPASRIVARFIDDSRDHVISSGEKSKVIFEIMNEGEQTIYNVVPMVTETTGMKRIYISPPVMVEQIAPHNGVKYTATISAGERIKTGNVTIRVAVADGNGQQYDWQEFSLPTER